MIEIAQIIDEKENFLQKPTRTVIGTIGAEVITSDLNEELPVAAVAASSDTISLSTHRSPSTEAWLSINRVVNFRDEYWKIVSRNETPNRQKYQLTLEIYR